MRSPHDDAQPPAFEPAGQFCPDCTCNNLLSATACEVCGAPLRGRPAVAARAEEPAVDPDGGSSEEYDDSLYAVPSDDRVSLGGFPSDSEADMAAGLLRSLGIAVEAASARGQGIPWCMLWVGGAHAATARRVLDEAARANVPGDGDRA